MLLGYYVDLNKDSAALPEPKVLSAFNSIRLPVFDTGDLALDLHALRELRGCANHWLPAGRVWRWLVEPVNGLLAHADNTLMWIRCVDMHRWWAFWNVITFLRELSLETTVWQSLFIGVFSELLGLVRELSYPQPARRCVWFSGDATTTRIGGINWDNRTYFALNPQPFLVEFMPAGRTEAHINEREFLKGILRTVLWGADDRSLLLLGVTDNSTSNMWFTKGRARRGVGLRLTRAFHRWVISQSFRYGPFYCRSEHNISADFTSRASEEELLTWEATHDMTRIDPTAEWLDFCRPSQIQTDTTLCAAPEPALATPVTPLNKVGVVVEWQPSGYTLCRGAEECGFHTAWISPRHSTMARAPQSVGLTEYTDGPIDLLGGLAKDLREARQFWEVLQSYNCTVGILLTPNLIDLEEMEFALHTSSGSFDSFQFGDILADRWNVYSFGTFDLDSFWYLCGIAP